MSDHTPQATAPDIPDSAPAPPVAPGPEYVAVTDADAGLGVPFGLSTANLCRREVMSGGRVIYRKVASGSVRNVAELAERLSNAAELAERLDGGPS